MGIAEWFVIGIVIVVIIFIFLVAQRVYTPYAPPAPDITAMTNLYTPTSPWGWNDTSSAVPVDGPDGICSVYTFTASERFSPAVVGFSSINSCAGGCEGAGCVCSNPQQNQVCIDDDQLFARKMKHRCNPNATGFDLRTTGTCRTQNGALVIPGTEEEFFTQCVPGGGPPPAAGSDNQSRVPRCPGTLGVIVFNTDTTVIGPQVFAEAKCMQDPNYIITPPATAGGTATVSNTSPLTGNTCDLRISYMGYPRQLFRVERATFDGQSFTSSNSGPFMKITHRPTGYVVAPTFSRSQETGLTGPAFGQPLQLISPTISASRGYWWYLSPQMSDPQPMAALNGKWTSSTGEKVTLNNGAGTFAPPSTRPAFTYSIGTDSTVSIVFSPTSTVSPTLSADQNTLTHIGQIVVGPVIVRDPASSFTWTRDVPVPQPPPPITPNNIARSQIAYIPDVSKMPPLNNAVQLWNYLKTTLVMTPEALSDIDGVWYLPGTSFTTSSGAPGTTFTFQLANGTGLRIGPTTGEPFPYTKNTNGTFAFPNDTAVLSADRNSLNFVNTGYTWTKIPPVTLETVYGSWNQNGRSVAFLNGNGTGASLSPIGSLTYSIATATSYNFVLPAGGATTATLSTDTNTLTFANGNIWNRAVPVVPPPATTPIMGVPIIMVPFIITDSTASPVTPTSPDPQAASKLASAQYMDYAIMGIIINAPRQFDFNGPIASVSTT